MAKFEQGLLVLHSPLGHTKATVSSSAVPLPDLPAIDRVRRIVIRALEGAIVYRDDGVAPTVDTGMVIQTNEVLVYDATGVDDFQMIAETVDSDVRIAYYGV